MNAKQQLAQMQIEAELAATLAKLTTLSQYVDPNSDYGKQLKKLQQELAKNTDLLVNAA